MTHPQFVTYGQIVTAAIIAEARFDSRRRAWKRALPCSQELRLRVRLRRARLPALDTELTKMMVEVLIHQHSPFHWS
jgi:hypothetical protein